MIFRGASIPKRSRQSARSVWLAATKMQRTRLVVLASLAALAAGCGGGDEQPQRPPASAPVVVRGQVLVEGKPVVAHVSLHVGEARELEDVATEDEVDTAADGRFVLRSDESPRQPTSFFVYVNHSVEFADFCDYIPLPLLHVRTGRWVKAADGRPLPPLAIRLPPDHEPIASCY
jgi:hypothetical protein